MTEVAKKIILQPKTIIYILLLVIFLGLVLLAQSKQIFTPEKNDSTGNKKTIAPLVDTCQSDQTYRCYKQVFKSYIDQAGIKPALESLLSLSNQNDLVKASCHSLAHDLGREAYVLTQGNIGKIFKEGNTTCWSGFYHGALEKAFSRSENLPKTAAELCTVKNGVTGSFLYYQCLHGLGHGLAARFDNEIYQALDVCKTLADSYQQNSCYGGVFMENYVANPEVGHSSKYLDNNDPIAPCNKVEQIYKYNCYQLVSIQILKLNGYNFGQAFQTCESAEKDFISVCYQSVGRDISGYTAEDPVRAVNFCAEGNSIAETECIKAVVSDSVYSKSSEKNVQKICDLVNNSQKSSCYSSAGVAINVLYDKIEAKKQACRTFPSDFQEYCLRELTS